MLICWIFNVYLIICFARVIFSWVPVDQSTFFGSISTFTYFLTEPLFNIVRNALPRPGDLPLDLAPVVVIFLLGVIRQLVC